MREDHVEKLKKEKFDVLVIGGGATGAGVALDAASRGLRVALVERNDFASGTSSRSTKLIHGGVRYLEQAVLQFDRSQFKLVRDALHERATLLKIAPHLCHPLAILTPLYNRLEVPYYRTGLRLYDRLAGKSAIEKSFFIGAKEALERFPMLAKAKLRGGVVYYDGQFDDARMAVCIALTAAETGAAVANYVGVTDFLKTKGRLSGAKVMDRLSGSTWNLHAKVIINATGPFLDSVRKLDDPKASKLLTASSGTHIVLDKRFSPPDTGLLIPKTEDGRVLFILPWLGHTLIGTTDNAARIVDDPKPSEEDINYILRQVRRYFSLEIRRTEIQSAWTGLRPLVSDPKANDTAKLSRDHIIMESKSGLITIAGGKWTTYRKMALDTVNFAVEHAGLSPQSESRTEEIFIAGGKGYEAKDATTLARELGVAPDIAAHLRRAYGDRAGELAPHLTRYGARLDAGHPFTEAEVWYAVEKEWARTTIDILARRTRLSFLDSKAAEKAAPRVNEILAGILGWKQIEKTSDLKAARAKIHY